MIRPIHAGDNAPTAAIIGLISTEFKDEIEELNPDLAVEEYEEELGRLVAELREKCDLLIVLAHAGEEETLAIAERFPRIDIIVASHVGDDPMPIPLAEDGVPVLFAGKRGMSVGVAKFSMQDGRAEFVSYEPKTLDSTFPDSPRILTLIEDYQQMIRVEKLLEAAPRIKHEIAQFKGDDACKRCHSLSSSIYHKSKHAHAFDPLVEKGHEYDPECVGCHTIGFGYRSGFVSNETTPELKHVGCENCHGPGGKHIEAPTVEQYAKVEQEVCVSCHTPDNSPTFVYSERIDKISHEEFFLCSAKICHWFY